MDAQELYARLGQIASSVPGFGGYMEGVPTESLKWLASLIAVLRSDMDFVRATQVEAALSRLGSLNHDNAAREIQVITYAALAEAEIKAPAAAKGAFVPVGNAHQAISAVGTVLSSAKQWVTIIDPYLDERAVSDFAALAMEQVEVRLLSDAQTVKPGLKPSALAWVQQWQGKRPLKVRLTPPGTLHDRLIIVDGQDVWVLTQSIKDFAVRSPASLMRADHDLATLKVPAYDALWTAATIVI